MKHKSLNQLLCAAMVNSRFRETLLRDPVRALTAGYYGHDFSLAPDERELVIGIQAQRLEDFAEQVYCWISGNGSGKEYGWSPESVSVMTGSDSDDSTDFRPALVPVYA